MSSGPSIMETLFQRTLEDLIKGIRLQLIGESAFISKSMEEIRKEIKCTDLQTKSIALQKLSYLNSLHFVDMSWAAFHCIEVMSSPRFAQKRIGYVAVSQSFNEHTPVLLLITNQLRKDLASVNEFEAGLALDCLANIATADLARDLTSELFTLLGSSKVSVRKKAIAVMLRVFDRYPDAVRVCFKRLVENLDNPDSRILSAAVGVFCELTSIDPRSYLPLAPEFYRILVDSKNNWVLIKILKIFANLAPLEPRLAKRVVEPICNHMNRTGAKSLMFECIRTVVCSLSEYESAVKLAVSKIRELLMEEDPNLKYLGLHALSVVAPKHLWVVLENKEVVIKSLSDPDSNIKFESLRLVMTVVSGDNIIEISRVLLTYALKSDPEFSNEILSSILSACGRNDYEIVMDFDWYVSLLGEMSRIPHCQKGEEIETQLIDIGMRVRDARPELVRVGRSLIMDPALLGNPFLCKILCAAAWVCGEYTEFSANPFELVEALLQPRTSLLPPLIRAVYLQSVLKVLTFCLNSYLQKDNSEEVVPESISKGKMPEASDLLAPKHDDDDDDGDVFNPRISDHSIEDSSKYGLFSKESIAKLLNVIESALRPLLGSSEVEILERARNIRGLINLIKQEIPERLSSKEDSSSCVEADGSKLIRSMNDAFCEELGPVSINAQERIPIPEGLVLEENLRGLDSICGDFELSSSSFFGERLEESLVSDLQQGREDKDSTEALTESTSLLNEHRKRHGLYYLPSTSSNDYPIAHEPRSGEQNDDRDETDDLVRLIGPKKKSGHSKPRPVVVKLDEGEAAAQTVTVQSKKPGSGYDSVSGVVKDVLQETDAVENEKEKRHKERRRRSKDSSGGIKGDVGETEKRSRNRDGRKKKARERAEGSVKVEAQAPVIPDFLL